MQKKIKLAELFYNSKYRQFKNGGGEENRTPVHYAFHENFSECSSFFKFVLLTKMNIC